MSQTTSQKCASFNLYSETKFQKCAHLVLDTKANVSKEFFNCNLHLYQSQLRFYMTCFVSMALPVACAILCKLWPSWQYKGMLVKVWIPHKVQIKRILKGFFCCMSFLDAAVQHNIKDFGKDQKELLFFMCIREYIEGVKNILQKWSWCCSSCSNLP